MNDNILRSLTINLDATVLPKKLTAIGTVGSYRYLIMSNRTQVVWIFNVKTEVFNKEAAEQFIAGLRKDFRSIRSVQFTSNTLELSLLPKTFAAESVEISNRINSYLATNDYVPCCMQCGETENLNVYGIPNKFGALILCEKSAEEYNTYKHKQEEEKEQKEERVIVGTLGALIGTIPGIALYVVLYMFDLLAAISALLVIICSIFLYEKFAGKLSKKGVIISVLASILALAIFCPWFAYSTALVMYNDEFKQAGFLLTFIETPFLIFSYSDLMSNYLSDLLWSLALGVLGTFSYVRNKLMKVTSVDILEKISL